MRESLSAVLLLATCFCLSTRSEASESAIRAQAVSGPLIVSEIMYNPPDLGAVDGDLLEFLELKNVSAGSLNLAGYAFTNGITYTFPAGSTLAAGQFVVLVSNAAEFQRKYPGVTPGGTYTGNLSNGGERLTLVNATGSRVFSFEYADQPPWPAAADGSGFSLVPVNPNSLSDPDNGAQWRSSSRLGGSPGQDDPPLNIPAIVVNEVLPSTLAPDVDAIELYNPTPSNVDISHWYLTDNQSNPTKFRIPAGTTIPAGGYRIFTESDFNTGSATSFSFSAQGEEVFLFSGDANGNLTGYSDGFSFAAAVLGIPFGRYTNSVGEVQYPALVRPTLGSANATPRVSPVVISKIQYAPAAGGQEYVEIRNTSPDAIRLFHSASATNTWRINGIGFSFPANQQIPAQGTVYVVSGDPAQFRSQNQLPATTPVFGPFTGSLDDQGERIQLLEPTEPVTNSDGEVEVPFIIVDEVRYDDQAPWPASVAGVERINLTQYGDDPANWRAAGTSNPGQTFEQWRATHFNAAELNDPAISGPNADADQDGHTNMQEFTAGTNPRSAQSRLQFTSIQRQPSGTGVNLSFEAVAGKAYSVEYRDSLSAGNWTKLADVPAPAASQVVTVPDPAAGQVRFYRIVIAAQAP